MSTRGEGFRNRRGVICSADNHVFQNTSMTSIPHFDAPLQTDGLRVLPEWIDYNGHMNVAYYVLAFDTALNHPLNAIRLGHDDIEKTGGSCFTLESHVRYLRELRVDAPLRVTFQLLDADSKRLHYIQRMFHAEEEYLAATCEEIGIHVDMKQRRVCTFSADVAVRVEAMRLAHGRLQRPENLCGSISLRRR